MRPIRPLFYKLPKLQENDHIKLEVFFQSEFRKFVDSYRPHMKLSTVRLFASHDAVESTLERFGFGEFEPMIIGNGKSILPVEKGEYHD